MIDFHSHILPEMDDGSQSAAESMDMLIALADQGIGTVVATPHFYATEELDTDGFIKRRDRSEQILMDFLSACRGNDKSPSEDGNKSQIDDVYGYSVLPHILKGAEIEFFESMSSYNDIEKLAITGTNLLMVEMPMHSFSRREIDALLNLQMKKHVRIIIAHIDRWIGYKGNENAAREMSSMGILLQMNADFINASSTRRQSFKYIKSGLVDILGSDCHNMRSRRPEIGEAVSHIRKKLGNEAVKRIEQFGNELLSK